VCYCNGDDFEIACPKDGVEGKSTKNRPAETGIESLKPIRLHANEINQAIQLIQARPQLRRW
jgi:hypothetical protein